MTESEGHAVMHTALELAKDALGSNLSAAYALGSLAHGGFAPLVSDVDLALIVEHIEPDTASRVAQLNHDVRAENPSRLAERLSVFWTDWGGVRRGKQEGRMPELDRLDLLESGSLLYGEDRRAGAITPQRDDLIRQAAEFTLEKFDAAYRDRLADSRAMLDDGLRPVTKAVLFPVRFGYTLHTGRIGRNQDAAAWYAGAGRELVAAAVRWRTDGIANETEAFDLLQGGLVPIYRQFVGEYAAALNRMGQQRLADELNRWGAGLH